MTASRAHRWAWLLFALSIGVLALWGEARPALAVGEGNFSLDKAAYSTPEGTAVEVDVLRTSGGVLQQDVAVTVGLSGGTAGFDYPNSTVTQIATFKAGENVTRIPLFFQTLNQNRLTDNTVIQVTILSASAGGLGSPATAPITILGRGAPRITNVIPKSGAAGSVATIIGENFPAACTTAPVAPADAAPRCTIAVGWIPTGSALPETFSIPVVVAPTQITTIVPPLSFNNWVYDLVVQVHEPGTPASVTSSALSAADQFTYVNVPLTITGISPAGGPVGGGTRITITGTGFTGCPDSMTFTGPNGSKVVNAGDLACIPISSTSFTVKTPNMLPTPGAGQYDVTATFGFNTSVPTSDSKFVFTGVPTITSMSTNVGPVSGGTQVTLVGTGFTGVGCSPSIPNLGVYFGGALATSCNVISDTQMIVVSPPGSILVPTVQVTVKSATGTSPFTTAANFTYQGGPIITAINPASGPPQGGAVVTITGAGFQAGATVTFGGVAAPFVTFGSSSQLQVTAPAGTGTVHVVVSVAGSSSPTTPADLFAYSTPVIDSIVPNAGPPAGGTVVTINGENFTTGATVMFGPNVVPSVFVSPLQIEATAPPGLAGMVDVRVTTPQGQSAISDNDHFTYTNGPIIAGLNPASGPTSGGIPIVITGTNFAAGATVMFGTKLSDAVNFNSATQITALLPTTGTPGVIDVKVTTAGGTSPVSTLSKFTYTATVPVIAAIVPNKAQTVGGAKIEISGSGFLGVSCPAGVKFGTAVATSCTVNSDSSITAIAPANVPGLTFLTVTSSSGTSDIAQNFTYVSSAPGSGGDTGSGNGNGNGNGTGGGTGGNGSVPGANLGEPTGAPVAYQLTFRWSLIVWRGKDGANIAQALQNGGDDLNAKVGAVFGWDPVSNTWLAYFPGSFVPGASTIQTFTRGGVYWISLLSPGSQVLNTTDG
jgi:hypothetical protein